MASPDVQDGNKEGDPSTGEDVQNDLVGVESSHHRRRRCVLIVAVVLCLFIIGGGASVPFVLSKANQSGSNRSTQLRTTSEPTVNSSEAPTGFNISTELNRTSEPMINSSEAPTGFRRSTRLRTRFLETTLDPSSPVPRTLSDCAAIKSDVTGSSNGTYLIDPDGRGPFRVYCDMTTDGGGWTVFQRRQDGSVNFNRNWTEYKTGFGNLSGDFWLGNEYIHRLTYNIRKTLRIDMISAVSFSYYEEVYDGFNISSEREEYTLDVESHIRGRSGSLRLFENGERFSTFDNDNDGRWGENTAADIRGGWWYRSDRYTRSPNGLFGTGLFGWYGSGYGKGMVYCDMKVR